MILRYLAYGLIFALVYVVGLIITPINYFIKDWLRELRPNTMWWFLNDTIAKDENDIDAGDYGRFKHNFWGYYMQNAIRNSGWTLKLLLAPKVGEKKWVYGNLEWIDPKWNYKVGKHYAEYYVRGVKYFRVSAIKEIWFFYFHYQFGSADNRYKYKIKLGLL